MNRSQQLLAVTIAGVLAVLLLGWFLLISPKRGDVQTTRDQTRTQLTANRQLQLDIDRLNSQAKTLPALQARLAAIGQRLPADPALPSFIRAITDAGDTAGMRLVSMVPAKPAALAAAEPGTASPVAGVSAVNITLVMEGTFAEVEEFFTNLEHLQRSMLVTGFQLNKKNTTDTSTTPELTLNLTGRVFFAVPAAPVTPAATAAPAA